MPDKKVLAIFDFDDTLFNGQSHSFFLSYLESKLPVHRRILLKIRKRMMWSKLNDREQKEFILSAFGGISAEQVESYAQDFFATVVLNRLNERVCSVLKEHREKGHTIVIASGGFEPYLKFIKTYFKVDHLICTRLMFNNGLFKGAIDGQECLGPHKAFMLKTAFNDVDVDWENSYVYSDHQSDIPLFALAGNKVVIDFGQGLDWAHDGYTRIIV